MLKQINSQVLNLKACQPWWVTKQQVLHLSLRGAPVENPETVATAIRIGNPQSWNHAKAVVRDSQGWFDELTDAEILRSTTFTFNV